MNKVLSRAPGRINIIGEHTDYTGGFVLPAAINMCTTFSLQLNGTNSAVRITQVNDQTQFTFDLNDFSAVANGWPNYVMGIVDEIHKKGLQLQGFDATFQGDVPIGAGMSSSAALECSFLFGLNRLFDLQLEPVEMVRMAQNAEHTFVGINCGIMDQFASVMGKKDHAIFLDCASLEYEYVPCFFSDHQFVLLNSKVSHELASSEYNQRRNECEAALSILNAHLTKVSSFRDLTSEILIRNNSLLPERLLRRSRHIISENDRVFTAAKALSENDVVSIGRLLYESHKSLRNDYEVSCEEIDLLVDLTIEMDNVLGSRMMGGGFGGCTLNLVRSDSIDEFCENAYSFYRHETGIELEVYLPEIDNGALYLD